MSKKFKTYDAAAAYVDSLPMSALRELTVSLLLEQEDAPRKISITEDQLRNFFKITGITADGGEERRGRPRK